MAMMLTSLLLLLVASNFWITSLAVIDVSSAPFSWTSDADDVAMADSTVSNPDCNDTVAES